MSKVVARFIKNLFFPPSGASKSRRLLPFIILGVLTIILVTGSTFAWDYTNSPQFCGNTCHTMPPEYTSYLASPHARVDCVDCHIGKGYFTTRVTRKAGDLKHVFATIFKSYEFPIHTNTLRPARETCEKCHFPEKFSDDSLREIKSFQGVNNDSKSIYLIMKTGGGTKREGLGRGIHWHIENKVYYLPLNSLEQTIPLVRAINEDGTTENYQSLGSDINAEDVPTSELKEMDCITCHNRISHLVLTPENMVDKLMTTGSISRDILEIRTKSIEVYSAEYISNKQALSGIAGLRNYYKQYYPDIYNDISSDLDKTITVLQDAYQDSVYPEQKSDWNSHPNNIGHQNTPGCFRCHDGNHLNGNNEAIRLECNLCHSIPVVVDPSSFVTEIEISRGPEPVSHLNTNWITLHRDIFDQTCSNCHNTENPGGADDSSFCSNSACHGSSYEFAGFDAPGLRETLNGQIPPTPTLSAPSGVGELVYDGYIGTLLSDRCGTCHGNGGIQGLNLTNLDSLLKGGTSGPVVIAGEPDSSLLIQKLTSETPHFSQLSTTEIDNLRTWISMGTP